MSRAALALESDSAQSSKSRPAMLRVNEPGDAYEREADRVAETVSGGGKVGGWSFARLDSGRVQRDPADPAAGPQTGPKPNNYDEALGKIGEAFLKTELGRQIADAAQKDSLVKGAEGFLDTLPGKIVAGAAATGAVSALAATHTPLPAQIPAIPLDKVKKGLSVKITWEGPVNRPTKAAISFVYAPGARSDKKTGPSATEQIRAGNASLAADLYRFQEGLKSPEQRQAEAADAQHALNSWLLPGSGAFLPGKHASEAKKKEEVPVQRKAEASPSVSSSLSTGSADVDSIVNSAGRPLDPSTRRFMEQRIGFDFSQVRVHADDSAAASARSLGARAYTVGNSVVFGKGQYAPQNAEGRRLLAHELTHVVQQNRNIAPRPAPISRAPVQIQRQEDDKGPSLFSDPKGWALAKLRKIPGYDLFCTIIGNDLVTGAEKERTPGTLIREVLKIVHGEEAYDRVVASGALEKAHEWVTHELESLGLNLGYFKGLVTQALDSISLGDLKDIPGAIARIAGIFRPALDKVLQFGKDAFHKLFEIAVQVVLEKLGGLGQRVLGIINKVGDTFLTIAKDPVKFVGNLVQAIRQGFSNFATHILKHLQDSLMDFLFGELGSKITPPKAFSVGAVFNLVLDVLDLHYDKFRERLVEKTSPETVTFLEGTFDFIMKLASAKTLAGAWEVFKQRASDLIDGLVNGAIDAIKEWVMTKIVQAAIVKIVQLFNPASAIVAAIEAIYHTIVVLIEKAKQLAAALEAVTNSIGLIAAGNLTQAVDWVEKGLAKGFSFVLAFFAEQAGLGGIGATIRKIIDTVREKVWGVIDKVIDYVIAKTKNLYQRGKAAAGKVLEWWHQRREVLIGDEEHAVYMEGSQEEPKLMIASTPTSWADYVSKLKPKQGQKALLAETVKLVAELEKPLNRDKSAGENSDQVTRKRTVFDQICQNIIKLGFQKEAPPKSEVQFDMSLAPGDGGRRATATVLSSLHVAGSQPSDEPDIWKNLGSLKGSKNYVQGHLLNHNLGGPGLRHNLTPINKKANSRHHAIIEKDIKRMVLQEKKVLFYEVSAVYDTHPAKPKPMIRLESEKAHAPAGKLNDTDEKLLTEYQAEQKLARGLEYKAYELQHTAENKWEKVDSTEVSGGIPNTLDLDH